jgi:regulator of protease activity HflC (stomatin/prohibitin superfamily)
MSLSAKLRRAPTRIVSGAFILNAGVGKLGGNDETAQRTHAMASGAYPFLEKVPPKVFLKSVAAGEIAVGAGLLLPVVPAGLAGLALVGFSGSLLGMWWRTPGMHNEGSPRPTQQGTAIAKDSWLLGIGAALVADAVLDPARTKRIEVTQGAKEAGVRTVTRASSAARLARARTEARAAKAAHSAQLRKAKAETTAARASAKAGARARVAKRASRKALDKVSH